VGIAHDNIGVDRRVQEVQRVFEVHTSNLLDHTVKIDDASDIRYCQQPIAKLFLVHLQCFEFLPPAGVEKCCAGQRKPQTKFFQRLNEVLPDHVSEPEENRTF